LLQGRKIILVFHLGGGSCDVSVIKIVKMEEAMTYQVIAVAGDDTLGGQDFDSRLMEHFLKEYCSQHKIEEVIDVRALRRLRTACERTKISLSTNSEAAMEIDCFYEGHDFFSSITRDCFEQLCGNLFEKIEDCVEKAIKEANTTKTKISDVIMIGGSTHIPKIREMIKSKFSDEQMNFTMDAAEVVVQGTVVQAEMLKNAFVQFFKEMKMTDVAAFSLNMKKNEGKMIKILDKNDPIPFKKIEKVTNSSWYCAKTMMRYEIFEYKDNNKTLVQDHVIDINHRRGFKQSFEVTLTMSEDGIFYVKPNISKMSLKELDIHFFNQRPHLDEDNISRMVKEAAHLASLDEQIRQCKLSRTKFLDCILYWEQAIAVEKEQQEFEDAHKDSIQKATRLELEWLDSNKYENAEALHNHLIDFDKKCEETLEHALRNSLPSWIFNVLQFERKSK
jgi:heat shock 70kDa protein 1/2/6/8